MRLSKLKKVFQIPGRSNETKGEKLDKRERGDEQKSETSRESVAKIDGGQKSVRN